MDVEQNQQLAISKFPAESFKAATKQAVYRIVKLQGAVKSAFYRPIRFQ
jgi:hypothetical protein